MRAGRGLGRAVPFAFVLACALPAVAGAAGRAAEPVTPQQDARPFALEGSVDLSASVPGTVLASGGCATFTVEARVSEAASWTARATAWTASGGTEEATLTLAIAPPAAPPGTPAAPSSPLAAADIFARGPARPSAAVPVPPVIAARPPAGPDVVIVKTVARPPARPGDVVAYTLTVWNEAGTARGVRVVDDFDERYMAVTDRGGGTLSGGRLTWDLGDLSSTDGSLTITYRTRLASTMPADVGVVDNVASTTCAEDVDPSNDRSRAAVFVDGDGPGASAAEGAPSGTGGAGDPDGALPRTGGPSATLALTAFAGLAAGFGLRRGSRRSPSRATFPDDAAGC